MSSILSIGGGQFMSRYALQLFLDEGHDVTLFTRGNAEVPFEGSTIEHVQGDRTVESDLERVEREAKPDIVLDFAGFHPSDIEHAMEVFSDVDAYVFVSSTHAYQRTATIPLKEGETPLCECTEEQATDESFATYGPRKAACDRVIFDAATRGVNAMSVRPAAIYGPHDPTERQDFWMDRVNRFDEVLVPGDEYRMPIHLGFVEDAAQAIRLVAERGKPGEAYNIASRNHVTFAELLDLIAEALGTEVDLVHASPRELATVGLSDREYPYCEPYPYIVSTEKLASLGWDTTSFEEGIPLAVADHVESDRNGSRHDPGRQAEEQLIERLKESALM